MNWDWEGMVFSNSTMRSEEFSNGRTESDEQPSRSSAIHKLLDPRRELRRMRMEAEDVEFEEIIDAPEPPKSAVYEGEKP